MPIDTHLIRSYQSGCKAENTLFHPYHVTGVKLFTNAVSAPLVENDHVRVYYKNADNETIYIPVTQV